MAEDTEAAPQTPVQAGLDILGTVIMALVIAVVFRVILFQPYTIPSSSMEPGLVTGDYLIVSKFAYGWSRNSLPFAPPLFHGRILGHGPKRGDVVVFRSSNEGGKTLIKRVIGLPGDRVQVSDGRVSVNGQPLPVVAQGPATDRDSPDLTPQRIDETAPGGKTYATFDRGPGYPGDDTGVYVVPEGDYFMMGDNRDNSLDSRWPAGIGVGFVPAEDLVGRADIVLASWNKGASLFKPWTWLSLHWDRFFKPIR
ncbi:MAG: signal peptidase I [Caulobacter sp.]|nr:signal peptidase I [Caulobacter sp.]